MHPEEPLKLFDYRELNKREESLLKVLLRAAGILSKKPDVYGINWGRIKAIHLGEDKTIIDRVAALLLQSVEHVYCLCELIDSREGTLQQAQFHMSVIDFLTKRAFLTSKPIQALAEIDRAKLDHATGRVFQSCGAIGEDLFSMIRQFSKINKRNQLQAFVFSPLPESGKELGFSQEFSLFVIKLYGIIHLLFFVKKTVLDTGDLSIAQYLRLPAKKTSDELS